MNMIQLFCAYLPFSKRYILLPFSALFVIFILLLFFLPFPISIEYSTIITDQQNNIIHAFLTSDEKWRMKTELSEITPELQQAILYKEDKYFYYHFGINPIAIGRAAFNNIVKSKRTSGASTITMQVARLLQPKARTYSNKLIEMFRAMQLECRYSKTEILQMYLNLVPYGSNIEGIKSASILFFDKAPNHLSLAEIATLAIIPNRPTSLLMGKNNAAIQKARDKWLNYFKQHQVFPATAITDALAEDLVAHRLAAPQLAPHIAYRLKKQYAQQDIIKTTIDLNQQKKVEQLVHNYIKRRYHKHIRNAAVLAIDNRTQEVLVYVGSADFHNDEDGGQVDGIRAIRSPGSTLKPFLYGLAFDRGLLTAKYKMSDVPINYSGYSPVNYTGDYNGLVTIEYALAQSLNVPAVKVLEQLGSDYFVDCLSKAGFEQIYKDRNKLGLSVALGGCGASLEELVRLYAAFANRGQLQTLKWLQADSSQLTTTVLSPSATYMLTEILTQLTRPDLPNQVENSKNLPKIAWKTGTSYGRRDAWSIGFNANYTIGVWVGNFSGEGVPELTGADVATPLLFSIFNSIDQRSQKDWFTTPPELDLRWVCSESGQVPQEQCENLVMDYYLPLVSSMKTCTHLKKVFVSPDSTHSYCTACLPTTGYKQKWYNYYSPEVAAFYDQTHIHYEKIPPHNPQCEHIFTTGNAPDITSPVNGLEYLIDASDNTQMQLTCQTATDVEQIYWYINGQFYQSAKAKEALFFVPKRGKNDITCVDDKGRKQKISVTVNFL